METCSIFIVDEIMIISYHWLTFSLSPPLKSNSISKMKFSNNLSSSHRKSQKVHFGAHPEAPRNIVPASFNRKERQARHGVVRFIMVFMLTKKNRQAVVAVTVCFWVAAVILIDRSRAVPLLQNSSSALILDHSAREEYDCIGGSVSAHKEDGKKKNVFTILVTGGAGFIGMHTSLELKRLGHTVVSYDNVNSYYSTALKQKRIDQLVQDNITFVEGDVCDEEHLRKTFQAHKVERIIHLAAQAGVRYSLDHPLEYTRNNVDCFVSLLETLVKLGHQSETSHYPVIYASSSSVYGLNTKIPFSETNNVDRPASIYAATKRSAELIAQAYFNIYQLNSIRLRFFTVYGPWGRPDMAPYIFTDRVSRNETITLFNHGENIRDFTFIDDIVDGIVSSLYFRAGHPEIINLGNSHPEQLGKFVKVIEDNVGRKADITSVNMQKGDVPLTYANTAKARCLLGYKPQVSIEDGIRKFVKWFKEEDATSQYRMDNQPFEACFVTSVYASDVKAADRPADIKAIRDANPTFRYFVFTNLEDLVAPGWTKVVERFPEY